MLKLFVIGTVSPIESLDTFSYFRNFFVGWGRILLLNSGRLDNIGLCVINKKTQFLLKSNIVTRSSWLLVNENGRKE